MLEIFWSMFELMHLRKEDSSSNVLIELHMHVIVQNGVEVNAQQ